jgi:chromosome segregation ATPase
MLYSVLNDDELERRVYIEPGNEAAKAELLRRVPDLIDRQDGELQETKELVDEYEKDLDKKAEELSEADDRIAALEDRIAELTNADDLV